MKPSPSDPLDETSVGLLPLIQQILVVWPVGSGLEGSGLEGSGLEGSGLEGSGLEGSGLEGSGLEGSGLEGSGLEGSGLEGSGLEGSGLEGSDDRRNADGAPMEFKSRQWFGASVRSDGEHILACAPLYQWSTFGVSEREPVGTCFLKKGSTVVEYSPCRSSANSPEGQGFCQAGFSVDFLKKNKRVVVGGPGSFYWQDVAVSAPYGGPDRYGLVYIHNGRPQGPNSSPSQVLQGKWASSYMPASFGYSMTGNTDVDQNGYPDFRVDLLLDRSKPKDTKRVLFLHSQSVTFSKNMTVFNGKAPACEEQSVFLRDDREFRDKITPISVVMEYSLDYQQAADATGLLPILDMSAPSNVTKQVTHLVLTAHILLDCGDDNVCKPDLRLSVTSDREQIFIGDDNALNLEISAENRGEGAYEAELHVFLPQQADFTGLSRRSQTLSRLSCAYKKENQTKMVVCDLGNPMKGGTKETSVGGKPQRRGGEVTPTDQRAESREQRARRRRSISSEDGKQHYVHNERLRRAEQSPPDDHVGKHCKPLKLMQRTSEEERQLFDLLGLMLEYDVSRRITLEEALWHPFFSPLRAKKQRS
ncbi:Integrin alpha-V [Liparis tanakae]|uniref:Integrin alpha-V n=1 Tax=Liparis tanakae TaxID=230148 RepID=A0A4Z2FWA6_9TELE|nr:Integrin alpha-V [Liparis tanakae]